MSYEVNDLESMPKETPKLIMSHSAPVYSPHHHDIETGEGIKEINPKVLDRVRSASDPSIPTTKKTKEKVDIFTFVQSMIPEPLRLTRQPSVPVFYCSICLENHPVSNSYTTSSCTFPHTYCRESIKAFAESIINESGTQIRCPGYGECQGIYQDEEIKNICDEETYLKFVRFREIKQNVNYRECPYCNHSTVGNELHPEITCEQCHKTYCYFHSNAHPNIPCHRYTKEQLHTQMKSVALIKTMTRNCPNCGTPTEKNGGCNHMTCQHCHEVFYLFILLLFNIYLLLLYLL